MNSQSNKPQARIQISATKPIEQLRKPSASIVKPDEK